MVFELSDSLINDVVINSPDIRQSLHNLFLGFEEGNLLLKASPELLDFLNVHLDDKMSKRIINYLGHSVMAHFDVMWEIKVVLENPDYSKHELSIDFFRKTSTIQPPTLLCENLNDTEFYFSLCKEYFGIDTINTKNGLGGGGSSIADILEHIVNLKDRFCLCIVDSDIKYPGCHEGGTFVAIQKKGLLSHPTFCIYKLNVHEIENLIPINTIFKYIKNEKKLKFLKKLKTIDNNGDILKYYDIKKGITLNSIQQDKEYYRFAEEIFNRLSKPSHGQSFNVHLSKIHDNIVFPYLCPGVLDAFLNKKGGIIDRYSYCDYLREDWKSIRNIIVTFFCARQNDPIN